MHGQTVGKGNDEHKIQEGLPLRGKVEGSVKGVRKNLR